MKINFYSGDLASNSSLGEQESLAIDTETMGLKLERDRLCLIQISDSNDNVSLIQVFPPYDCPNLKKLLSNNDILKIFHFARFDLQAIKRYLCVDVKNVYCTKIAAKLCITYSDRHGLASLARRLLKVDLNKQQQTSDWGKKEIDGKQLNYAANDVLYLHKIRNKLEEILIRENRQALAQECFDFLPTLVKLDIGNWQEKIFNHS